MKATRRKFMLGIAALGGVPLVDRAGSTGGHKRIGLDTERTANTSTVPNIKRCPTTGFIPQSFINELLHRVNIVDVIGKRAQLKKSGRNYVAFCPFRREKTPSFSVNEEKQFYYCYGCGTGGNAIGFLMAYEHANFEEAVETLAREYGF